MYNLILALHNLMRWVVVILAILALVRAYSGWLGRRSWTPRDRQIGSFFGISADIQFLLGLLLYFVFSPLTRTALQDFGAAMGNNDLRFFAVEHVLLTILAIILIHLGSVFSRRAVDDTTKHQRAAIFFSLAALLLLIAIPWWRPLLPGLG